MFLNIFNKTEVLLIVGLTNFDNCEVINHLHSSCIFGVPEILTNNTLYGEPKWKFLS